MSKSSEDNKSNAIRFGEREIGDSDHRPTRTAAASRHAQFELGEYNDSPRDEEMDGTADVYGSVPSDKRDMMRMGKDQELRVSGSWIWVSFSGLVLTLCYRECLDKSRCCRSLLSSWQHGSLFSWLVRKVLLMVVVAVSFGVTSG
jgi:hypothetical protein